MNQIDQTAIAQLFTQARTYAAWRDKAVPDSVLKDLYDLMKWGPTSGNSTPARVVFVRSPAQKAALLECMAPGNVEKTRAAPVTAIVAYDLAFFEHLPRLFPHADMRGGFAANPERAARAALMNGSLQGGYFILAARALGLDCGPMGGFDAEKVNAAFFAESTWRVNFICNLGYGDAAGLHPRGPRLSFDEACRIV
ncbi:malonic semialdehyde reductase [Pandoraea sp.]|uniref:malonic semialdehyde reductase n=1 Tax=Pandoraea sp. TaxID=1883445 RepID=UPI00120BEF6B|nr:malonic semialdehyde reductase [Pandoraea sp.]TAL54840.1 MAG: malonic semialdehyde reductase [Pandoraea sp.]TAM18392.1 MAG: malonic semialdehyde reductase [Pandoraea sp.]